MNKTAPGNQLLISRILSAILGGYVFTWGFAALGIVSLMFLGVDFHEAETAVLMLAFVVFLTVFLWAFACRSVAAVWAVLAGGGGVMALSAWALQLRLLS